MPKRTAETVSERRARFEAFLLWLNRHAFELEQEIEPGVTELVRGVQYEPAAARASRGLGNRTLRRMLNHAAGCGLIYPPAERESKRQHARSLGYWIGMPYDLAAGPWRERLRAAAASFRGNQRRRVEHRAYEEAEAAARERFALEQADRDVEDDLGGVEPRVTAAPDAATDGASQYGAPPRNEPARVPPKS